MKTTIKYILPLVIFSVLFSGCNKDFLNTEPLDKPPASTVWADPSLSEAFVTDIYDVYHDGILNQESMDCISDNCVYNFGRMDIMEGNISPGATGWVNNTYEWGEMYARIRATNVALENLATASFDPSLVDRLKGESYFLRAHCHNQLLRYYGGVPIIKSTYALNTPDFSVPRNTYAECVDAIVGDLDSAALLLNGKTMALGRATKEAALALKSRVLLYAASDLHDIPTAKAKSALIASYPNPEFLGYVSGDRTARWQAAKDAAKAVLDQGGGGYKLDYSAPASRDEAIQNYISISMGGGSKAPGVDATAAVELLFQRDFNAQKDEYAGIYVGLANGPNGYHNWAGNSPIQELVDDYEMMDGTKFDWNKADEKAKPYNNRDPRFYASMMYDGSGWKPRDKISGNVDPANQIQTGQYDMGGGNMIPGLDTRQSTIENWNGSWTGYYARKFIDPDPNIVDNNTRQYIPWPFFRYTEAVLNYVEACIELGQDDEAKTWLNKIRFRAGMPALVETGDALRQR